MGAWELGNSGTSDTGDVCTVGAAGARELSHSGTADASGAGDAEHREPAALELREPRSSGASGLGNSATGDSDTAGTAVARKRGNSGTGEAGAS